MATFKDLNILPSILQAIEELGYTEPSPIQAETLPKLLGQKTDFIGLAATGTGKTAAFGIPLLEQIDTTVKKTQALIMCPTRELAMQVSKQINLLGKHLGVKSIVIYGGAGYNEQLQGLRSNPTVIVGTPGRLIDHLERGTMKLDNLKVLVLDEADEMISMGFKDDLETIMSATPRDESHESNIWLFSATMSKEIRRVADKYLRNPAQVQVNRTEMLSATVEQTYYPSRESDKPEILCKIIEAADDFYGIIFCQTKTLVTDLTHYLTGRGYRVDSLHGDKSQDQREKTMQAFRDKKVRILVCTDVASRGLDVKDVSHVVNYSIPRELDVYVHRIGRTARSGKAGKAISLVTAANRQLIGRIENMTKSKILEGKIPSRREIASKKVAMMLEKFDKVENSDRIVELIGDDWKTAFEALSKEEIAARFVALLSPETFTEREREKPLQQAIPPAGSGRYQERKRSDENRRSERDGGGGGGFRRDSQAPRGDDRAPRRAERSERAPRRDSQAPRGDGWGTSAKEFRADYDESYRPVLNKERNERPMKNFVRPPESIAGAVSESPKSSAGGGKGSRERRRERRLGKFQQTPS